MHIILHTEWPTKKVPPRYSFRYSQKNCLDRSILFARGTLNCSKSTIKKHSCSQGDNNPFVNHYREYGLKKSVFQSYQNFLMRYKHQNREIFFLNFVKEKETLKKKLSRPPVFSLNAIKNFH